MVPVAYCYPNYYGVRFTAPGALTGQTVVSGNLSDGVLFDTGSGGARATSIYIGTVLSGTGPLGNGGNGIRSVSGISGPNASVSTSIIAGNAQNGVQAGGSFDIVTNYIGTNYNASVSLPNGQAGVEASAARSRRAGSSTM